MMFHDPNISWVVHGAYEWSARRPKMHSVVTIDRSVVRDRRQVVFGCGWLVDRDDETGDFGSDRKCEENIVSTAHAYFVRSVRKYYFNFADQPKNWRRAKRVAISHNKYKVGGRVKRRRGDRGQRRRRRNQPARSGQWRFLSRRYVVRTARTVRLPHLHAMFLFLFAFSSTDAALFWCEWIKPRCDRLKWGFATQCSDVADLIGRLIASICIA